MMVSTQKNYDVIVVGGGLAGLSAAKELHDLGKNYLVLEATDRLGGKVYSKVSEDTSRYFELGAQFLSKEMKETIKLVEESGMTLKETRIPDNLVVISEKSKEPIRFDFKDIPEMLKTVTEIDSEPQSLDSLLDKHVGNKRKRQLIKSFVAAEATINSQYINAEALKELVSRITTTNNGLNYQASGPLSQMIRYLQTINDDAIRYLEPVEKIKENEQGYTIRTKNKTKYHAKAVILAIPPTAALHIRLSDTLKNHYENYLKSYTDGSVIKMTFVYDDAFWREKTIKGTQKSVYGVIYTANEGVNLMDSSCRDDEYRLTLYIGGDKAKELSSVPKEVKEFFAQERLIEVFGEEADTYRDYEISEWQDSPYTGGGYSAMIHAEGDIDAVLHLKEPFNNIIFASTELDDRFPRFMEGAVRSGQYAVKQLYNNDKISSDS